MLGIKLWSKSRILLPFAVALLSLQWINVNEDSVISHMWMSSRILDVCIHSFDSTTNSIFLLMRNRILKSVKNYP